MNTTTRSREYREGWLGHRRTYKCRKCGEKFQVDTREPLPEERRLCDTCKEATWTRSDCPICGRSFPHKKSEDFATCGNFECLAEARTKGLLDKVGN